MREKLFLCDEKQKFILKALNGMCINTYMIIIIFNFYCDRLSLNYDNFIHHTRRSHKNTYINIK